MSVRGSADQSVLVVAGEASGDRIAAAVARELRRRREGLSVFGMGGAACAASGVDLVADLRDATAMGGVEVARRIGGIVRAMASLVVETIRRRPVAAVLVGYTEFCLVLGRLLARRGVRVLWCVAPQVWAWRPGRARSVRAVADRMAVILPFEEPLWRRAGVDAHWVGHPAAEARRIPRGEARARLGLRPADRCVAILPGSRPHEARALLGTMLAAFGAAGGRGERLEARVLLAPSLAPDCRAWATREAAAAGVRVAGVDPVAGAGELLAAFDAALCASGTASLEAALAGAAPVVAYRVIGPPAFLARRMLRTRHVALPNVLLGERCCPERIQDEVRPAALARDLEGVLRDPAGAANVADRLRAVLATADGRTVAERTAALALPWLAAPGRCRP